MRRLRSTNVRHVCSSDVAYFVSFLRSDLTPNKKKLKKRKWKKNLHILKVCWKQKYEGLNDWVWRFAVKMSKFISQNKWLRHDQSDLTGNFWPVKYSQIQQLRFQLRLQSFFTQKRPPKKRSTLLAATSKRFYFFFIGCVGTGFAFYLNVLSWLLMFAGCEQASCRLFIRLLAGAWRHSSAQLC